MLNYWTSSNRKFGGFADDQYYLPSLDEVKSFHEQNPIQHAPELNEGFDCDDFSFVYKGMISLYGRNEIQQQGSLCVGIAWGHFAWRNEYHACNWFLDENFNVFWIEPQDEVDIAIKGLDECEGGLTLVLV